MLITLLAAVTGTMGLVSTLALRGSLVGLLVLLLTLAACATLRIRDGYDLTQHRATAKTG